MNHTESGWCSACSGPPNKALRALSYYDPCNAVHKTMSAGIAVLMYHELEIPGRNLCQSEPGYVRYVVPVSAFEAHLRHLKALGYEGMSLGCALDVVGAKQVVLTFDDGSETDLTVAAPMLSTLGFGATFYVTVGFLGNPGYMTESQLRELSTGGFEIGCHSLTHPYLSGLDAVRLHREIVDAKDQLQQIVGRPVEHYSCPGGRFNDRVVATVKEAGYLTLANSRPQRYSPTVDRYMIGRTAILRHTSLQQLEGIVEGRGLWKLDLEQNFRSIAKRFLGDRLYEDVRAFLLSSSRSK